MLSDCSLPVIMMFTFIHMMARFYVIDKGAHRLKAAVTLIVDLILTLRCKMTVIKTDMINERKYNSNRMELWCCNYLELLVIKYTKPCSETFCLCTHTDDKNSLHYIHFKCRSLNCH